MIEAKQKELHQTHRQITYYKREIDKMRAQLDGSYNIQKIMQLENEQSHALSRLKQLERDYSETIKYQKDQEKAMKVLRQNGQYEKKFTELNSELKAAKDHYRKLQVKERED